MGLKPQNPLNFHMAWFSRTHQKIVINEHDALGFHVRCNHLNGFETTESTELPYGLVFQDAPLVVINEHDALGSHVRRNHFLWV